MLNIPLFPLNTVLFPAGVVPLRVFELRYTDMVRDCLREGTPFGVVNIVRGSGAKTASAQEHHIVGTLATVIDFDMHDPGVLLIAVQGGQRFKVLDTHAKNNGLIRADVELIDSEATAPVPEALDACVKLAMQISQQLEEQFAEAEKAGVKPFVFPLPKPYQFEEAGWLANRYAELMPLEQRQRQMLLEMLDPVARLRWVYDFLKSKDIIDSEPSNEPTTALAVESTAEVDKLSANKATKKSRNDTND